MASQYSTFPPPTQWSSWQHVPSPRPVSGAPSQPPSQATFPQRSVPPQPILGTTTSSTVSVDSLQAALRKDICALPTCQRQCFVEPRGIVHNYCSRAHAQADAATRRSFHHSFPQTSASLPTTTEYSRGDKQHRPNNPSVVSRCSCGRCHDPQASGKAQKKPLTQLPSAANAHRESSAMQSTSDFPPREKANATHTSGGSAFSGPAATSPSTGASISTLLAHGLNSVANGIRNHYLSKESSSDIFFYHRGAPYFAFTNFAEYPIVLDGIVWRTTEHYFQAQKFKGTHLEQAIRWAPTARDAFNHSHQPNSGQWVQPDWEMVKDDVMLRALRAKFTQHTELHELLVSTRPRRLVEHTDNDYYWADGGDGSGLNRLGELLMTVRDELASGQLR